jgi:hypothetical protein
MIRNLPPSVDIEHHSVTPPYTAHRVIGTASVLVFQVLVTTAIWLRHAALGLSVCSLAVAGRASVPAALIGAGMAAGAATLPWIVLLRG